jgi:hypothetical protein
LHVDQDYFLLVCGHRYLFLIFIYEDNEKSNCEYEGENVLAICNPLIDTGYSVQNLEDSLQIGHGLMEYACKLLYRSIDLDEEIV